MQVKKAQYGQKWAMEVVETFNSYWGRAPEALKRKLGISDRMIATQLRKRTSFWERYKKMVVRTNIALNEAYKVKKIVPWQAIFDGWLGDGLLLKRLVLTERAIHGTLEEHVSIGGSLAPSGESGILPSSAD